MTSEIEKEEEAALTPSMLVKHSCNKCFGRGIEGVDIVHNADVVCKCVYKAMKALEAKDES